MMQWWKWNVQENRVAEGSIITLDNGTGYSKEDSVLDGWTIDNVEYELYALCIMPGNDTIAYAIWKDDSDNDGISNADEGAAGSDPNDPNDTPMKGGIDIAVDSLTSTLECVLNSEPRTDDTDADGNASFETLNLYLILLVCEMVQLSWVLIH